jgi:hypothetical protein
VVAPTAWATSAAFQPSLSSPSFRTPAGPDRRLSLVVTKQVFPHVFASLWYARRTGTPLWNDLTATIAFGSRLIGLSALAHASFRTPEVTFAKSGGEYVAKDCDSLVDDRFWAVDVNLAAGYRNTELEAALCESIRAELPGQ